MVAATVETWMSSGSFVQYRTTRTLNACWQRRFSRSETKRVQILSSSASDLNNYHTRELYCFIFIHKLHLANVWPLNTFCWFFTYGPCTYLPLPNKTMNCIPCLSEDHGAVSARKANRRCPEVAIIWFRLPLSTWRWSLFRAPGNLCTLYICNISTNTWPNANLFSLTNKPDISYAYSKIICSSDAL